jgi:uncharacterized protein
LARRLHRGRRAPAFVCDPTGHLAAAFVLQRSGTDFHAHYGWNLVAGDDDWAAPIAAEVGPDGNMWVLDWYNVIVQHNPTPAGFRTGKGGAYETELRDKKFGRVYRLVPKGQKVEPTTLAGADDNKLVATLKNPTMMWRLHAQRLLAERKAVSTAYALAKLVADPSVDEIGLNVGAMHALWTLSLLDIPGTTPVGATDAGLEHQSAAVRRAAIAGMAPTLLTGVQVTKCFQLLQDPDALVRLAALLKLSEVPASEKAGKFIADALLEPANLTDRWLPDALTSAAATHDLFVLKAIAARKLPPKALATVAVVAEHLARRAPDKGMDVLVASLGDADPKTAETVIAAIAKGWPKGKTTALTPESEKALTSLLAKLPTGSKGQLIRLASAWGSKAFEQFSAEIAKSLMEELADEKASGERRVTAAKQLIELRPGDGKLAQIILDTITLRSSPGLAAGFIEAVGGASAPEIGNLLVARYAEWPPSTREAALRVLLSRPDLTRAFLDAADKSVIQVGELTLDQKQGLTSHPDTRIAQRAKSLLAKGGRLPNADRQKVIEEMLPITKKTGDAAAGKAMFTKHCAACHQHSGEGTRIGPDLTGMAVHPKEELLINILDPSRSVEGNFRLYQVTLVNEKVLNGMLASETKTTVELIDSQAKRHVLLREDIDSLKASTKSLMPDGFEKQMNADELTNLLEFLTKRGKYLPIPLDKAATIVSTKGMFYAENAQEQRLVFPDWKPKTVEGVPFVLIDPLGEKVANVILLHGPIGDVSKKMPKSAMVTVNSPAKAIHILGGVSGWGFPYAEKGSVSLKVRLVYDDGKTEEHALKNGEHLADYIRRVDVPGSKFAFNLNGRQLRYLSIAPLRENTIKQIEFVKGDDQTAPLIVAVTVEGR